MDSASELILASARYAANEGWLSEVRRLAGSATLDWQRTLQLAAEHGVLPLLHRAIERANVDTIDPEPRRQLRELAHDNARRTLLLLRELLLLVADLRAEGVRVLPYKGPLLAMQAYGEVSLRQAGDLDILVPEADLDRAKAVLARRGYRPLVSMDARAQERYLTSPHEYDFVFQRDSDATVVELHWRVAGRLLSFDPDPIDLWNRGRSITVGGTELRVMSPEDSLLILCAHGGKHFWSRLVWICDVAQSIRSNPSLEWAKLLRHADRLEARGMTLLGLALANQVLRVELPIAVSQAMRPSSRQQAANLEHRLFLESGDRDGIRQAARMQLVAGGLLESILFHTRTRDSWTTAARYCFHRVFTPNSVDTTWVHLPRSLGWMYYLLRPVRLAVQYAPNRTARPPAAPLPASKP